MKTGHRKSSRPCHQPKRNKLALLTFLGLLAPVYFVPPALTASINGPRWLSVSAAVAVIVVLMTYIIMPLLKFIAADWLCGRPSRRSTSSEDSES